MGDRKDLFGCGEKVRKEKGKYFYLAEKKNERIKIYLYKFTLMLKLYFKKLIIY